MDTPRETQQIIERKARPEQLFDQYFDLAVSLLFQNPDKGYIFVSEDAAGEPQEHINLMREDGTVMNVFRPVPEHQADAPFPYWVTERSTAFSPATHLPHTVATTYKLDRAGWFHQELVINNEALLAPVDEAVQMRLLRTMSTSEVAYVRTKAPLKET